MCAVDVRQTFADRTFCPRIISSSCVVLQISVTPRHHRQHAMPRNKRGTPYTRRFPTRASIPRLFLHGQVEPSGEEAVLGRRRISRISPRRRRASWSQGWSCVAGQRLSGRLLRAALQ